MSTTGDTPIPARLAGLPRHGGFPAGFVFAVGENGIPDFTVLDDEKVMRSIREKLCGLCGQPLDYWVTFVGGPRSVQNRRFLDPAMHEDCARYALSVCPFLLGQKDYAARKAHAGLDRPDEVRTLATGNPERFALYVTRGYKIDPRAAAIRANAPARVEWFEHGHPLSPTPTGAAHA